VDGSGDFPKERFRACTFASNRKRDTTTNGCRAGRPNWLFHSRAEIDRRGCRPINAVCVNILRYAHNFRPRAISADPNPLAQSVARLAPTLTSHVLGYERDATMTDYIPPGEIAPGYQSRTLGGKEAGRDILEGPVRRDLVRWRLSFNGDEDTIPILRFHRQAAGKPGRRHARNGGKPAENFGLYADYPLRLRRQRLRD
jgi:hypothetical protein